MIFLKKILFLFLVTIVISSCNNSETETEQNNEQNQIEQLQEIVQDSLSIIGDNVNVREQPSTSATAVMKLQRGEAFQVLDKSPTYETVGTETDYWYRIEKKGEAVWVFGAFTSQNLNDNPQIIRVVYEGTEQGDYFHMTFSDEDNDISYDFGEAFWSGAADAVHHNFGQYDLKKDEKKYKGKTFDVTWKVVLQDTYAGEGLMESVKREIPIITNLKLVK
jgi:hypothetical protein